MTDKYDALKLAAQNSIDNAYSPYSKIKIGAAVLASSGKIYTGANIENASYGATICAERTAIVKAMSENEKYISAIAITGDINDYAFPCGICRQVMSEFMSKDAIVFVSGKDREWKTFKLKELLPNSFDFYDDIKGR
ncbi:MAG TPA: cytidine deaminase [Clostridia bacterium]|jgi:cytidine deaminase|nr:cytidine deaminase [Clostridia bacterium]HPJ77014.1 cytidine deaminase [Clostridia bacterium]HXK71078.1 cytidine deaminase [Clostridia bacterium]